MAGPWSIRAARLTDIGAISAAERVCFSDPWSEQSIRELFQNETTVGLVASQGPAEERLAGYLFARTIAGEGEILNLAVLPGDRKQGLGAALLVRGIAIMTDRGASAIFLEVRESNEAARNLYRRAGFSVVGLRADYYRSPREHALVLRRELVPAGK